MTRRGKSLLGGNFTTISGTNRNYLARINADGSLDATFNPNPNQPVLAITIQPDGRILVAGAFTSIGGSARSRVARFNPDGALDLTFSKDAALRVLLPPGSYTAQLIGVGDTTGVGLIEVYEMRDATLP